MAIIKCKMCGGDLRIEEGTTVCECEYCGTRQTVPSADNEKKLTLFSRAGRLLRSCEFDKAAGVFETIVADFPEEAEAYWGLVLCKYGIEYVDDPATGKKVPTCHRSSFDSVLDDPNFEQACENTDAVARRVYRDEARQIEDLRQAILQVSGKEEPYDVFISYKETDENGDRTLDSVIAQDIYKELTGEGYRVFFSRISLEDKLGTEYEPYIFAALNSAKVMLVVGTDYENFDSVWVKNEWSRFLKLIAAGQKKTLIPVFKNMDAYDMPKEFAKLAAQDMGKVGAMQDLVRGVEKIVGKKKKETVKETVVVQQSGGPNVTALLKRGNLALENGEWDKAKGYFDNALNMDAESAEAYYGLFLVETQTKNESEYIRKACSGKPEQDKIVLEGAKQHINDIVRRFSILGWLDEESIRQLYRYDAMVLSSARGQKDLLEKETQYFEQNRYMKLALRFAAGSFKETLESFRCNLGDALRENVARAVKNDNTAKEKKEQAYQAFIEGADKKAEQLYQRALEKRNAAYQDVLARINSAETVEDYLALINTLRKDFSGEEGRDDAIAQCNSGIAKCKKVAADKAKAAAEEAEYQRILAEKTISERRAKLKKIGIIVGVLAISTIAAFLILTKVIIPNNQYKAAETLFGAGQYEEAIAAFSALGDYKDSENYSIKAQYSLAEVLLEEERFAEAAISFGLAGNYKDARERCFNTWKRAAQRNTISAGLNYTVGIKNDGSVISTTYTGENNYGQSDTSNLMNIVYVVSSEWHTVGLKEDGTVVAVGSNFEGQCNVSEWKDIVAIAAGNGHTVGLKSDGSVIAVGRNENKECEVSDWSGIVAVAAGGHHTVGLKADGTVVAVGENDDGQCYVSRWSDIVAIEAGWRHTIGLKADGTVIASGRNKSGQCNISDWTDIIAISAGEYHTVGLKVDGTVIATDNKDDFTNKGQCEVSDWENIVAIAAGEYHTVGLKIDGTAIATEYLGEQKFYYGQCDVSDWTDLKLPETSLAYITDIKAQAKANSDAEKA